MSKIFRPAALAAQAQRFEGEPAIRYPLSAKRLLIVLLALTVVGLAFVVRVPYTEFADSPGVVLPQSGQTLVVAEQRGRFWSEAPLSAGRRILRGERLGWIEVAANAAAVSSLPDTSLAALNAKHRSLLDSTQASIQAMEHRATALRDQLKMLDAQRTALQEQRRLTQTRLELKQGQMDRYSALKASGFVSSQYLTGVQDDVVALKAQDADVRQRLATLDQKTAELRESEVVARDEARKERASALQDAAEVNSRIAAATAGRRFDVVADREMTLTAVHVENGSWVASDDPLVSAETHAEQSIYCFVDGRTIVHVQAGTPVRIRYPSYPHLIHGTFAGLVTAVERSPWLPSDIERRNLGDLPRDAGGGAYFKVTVRPLPGADGRAPIPLVNGMQARVMVPHATRTLFQWLFLSDDGVHRSPST